MGGFEETERVFDPIPWLNPRTDNQGGRLLIDEVDEVRANTAREDCSEMSQR